MTDLDPDDPDRDAILSFRLVVFVAQQLRYLTDVELAADDLTTQQATLLSLVALSEAPPSLSDAALVLGTSHQNAKKVAAVLVRKRFVALKPDPTDGRVKRLALLARGRAHWTRADKPDHAMIAEVFAALSTDERARLRRLLTKLATSAATRARAQRSRA